MTEIVYAREPDLSVDDYIKVVGNSSLGPTRPLADHDRVARMLRGADLIVTARLDGECVGVARALTDFAWVCYLGDLAVSSAHQGRGIGKRLLQKVRDEIGEEVGLTLVSMPDAKPFYDRVGPAMDLHPIADSYWMKRRRGV